MAEMMDKDQRAALVAHVADLNESEALALVEARIQTGEDLWLLLKIARRD